MTDIALNAVTHDLQICDGDLLLIDQRDRVAQQIKIRLLFFRGEWFLDTEEGVPYFQEIFKKPGDQLIVEARIKEAILEVPGVTGIKSLELDYDEQRRCLGVVGNVASIYGNIPYTTKISEDPNAPPPEPVQGPGVFTEFATLSFVPGPLPNDTLVSRGSSISGAMLDIPQLPAPENVHTSAYFSSVMKADKKSYFEVSTLQAPPEIYLVTNPQGLGVEDFIRKWAELASGQSAVDLDMADAFIMRIQSEFNIYNIFKVATSGSIQGSASGVLGDSSVSSGTVGISYDGPAKELRVYAPGMINQPLLNLFLNGIDLDIIIRDRNEVATSNAITVLDSINSLGVPPGFTMLANT